MLRLGRHLRLGGKRRKRRFPKRGDGLERHQGGEKAWAWEREAGLEVSGRPEEGGGSDGRGPGRRGGEERSRSARRSSQRGLRHERGGETEAWSQTSRQKSDCGLGLECRGACPEEGVRGWGAERMGQ